MKRQGGFTLIELVVVIVILGILAVTAAPRFLNLQNDARKSAIAGLAGAMNGGAGITYGKSAVEGEDTKAKNDAGGAPDAEGITTHYGYPTATATGIVAAVQGLEDTTQWAVATSTVSDSDATPTVVAGFAHENSTATTIKATNCYVTYTEATDKTADKAYKVVVVDTDC